MLLGYYVIIYYVDISSSHPRNIDFVLINNSKTIMFL